MKCKYCNKPAGLFKSKHEECESKHCASLSAIQAALINKFENSELYDYRIMKQDLFDVKQAGFVNDSEFDCVFVKALDVIFSGNGRIDNFRFPNLLASMPSELRTFVLSLDIYAKYWCNFFENYLVGLDKNGKMAEEYYKLLKDIKQGQYAADALNKMFLTILHKKFAVCLDTGMIEEETEAELSDFIEQSTLSGTAALNNDFIFQKLVQLLVIRDIKEGRPVTRIKIDYLPILLGKKEEVIWVFKNVDGYEEKTGRRYEGGSSGVSMRICKGVYYRVGTNKGYSVSYQYQNPLGRGIFIVTNKNLYFIGTKQVKLSISKILSFKPYDDGITLIKDGVTPRPYTFVGCDSWFIINAMQLVMQ